MPDMNGYELTRIIRTQYPEERDLVIVALSAKQRSDNLDKCLAASRNDMLSKPFTAAELE